MKKKYGSPILDSSFRIITPFTLIYGVYVFLNGEISPGGGFQAGALLAVGVVLSRLIIGADNTTYNVTGRRAVILAGVGTFIYALTGWVTMLRGGIVFGLWVFALCARLARRRNIAGASCDGYYFYRNRRNYLRYDDNYRHFGCSGGKDGYA